MRVSLVVVCLAALGVSAGGPGPRTVKAAWEWDVEERIAVRLSSSSPARKVVEAGNPLRPAGERYFDVNGATHPELLLPHEVFGALIDLPDERRIKSRRARYDPAIAAAGWNPDEFWRDLGRITAAYLSVQQEDMREQLRANTLPPAERRKAEARAEQLGIEQCRLRVEALHAAREHFGPAFDRFLYTAVAPKISIGGNEPGPNEAEQLRRAAGGCR